MSGWLIIFMIFVAVAGGYVGGLFAVYDKKNPYNNYKNNEVKDLLKAIDHEINSLSHKYEEEKNKN